MKRKTIKFCALVLVVALCVPLLLSGCGKKTLWIVTDAQSGTRRNLQITKLIKSFEAAHPEVTVEFERLPTSESERDVVMTRLRTAVMAGKGPDIFLLATPSDTNYLDRERDQPSSARGEDLFDEESEKWLFYDVQQAMHNGLFLDISKYYDADTELKTEELVPAVMDAGVYDGRRFVLPFRFDVPIAYVDTAQFEAAGYSMDVFDRGFVGLMDTVISTEDKTLATWCYDYFTMRMAAFNYFNSIVDYEAQEVTLTADQLADFLDMRQSVRHLSTPRGITRYDELGSFLWEGYCWTDEMAMKISRADDAITYLAMTSCDGVDITMVPLTTEDGTLVADVTCYGAVGASCDEPELAYEFLRQFLLDDNQWERDLSNSILDRPCMTGWPVRSVNAVQHMFENHYDYWKVYYQNESGYYKLKKLKICQPSEEDVPDWYSLVDVARFPLPVEKVVGEVAWTGPNTYASMKDPSIEDNIAFADKIIDELKWHIAEG